VSFPKTCDICAKAKVNTHLFHGNIELALRPIKGANPSVLLVDFGDALNLSQGVRLPLPVAREKIEQSVEQLLTRLA